MTRPAYAIVTPVRNEAGHLPRLAASIAEQSVVPEVLLLVENGSTDGTAAAAEELAGAFEWIRVLEVRVEGAAERGPQIVRAVEAGLAALDPKPEFVAKVDADVELPPTYFERLLDEFARRPALGIASGTCFELMNGTWRERFGTGDSVWGAARMYRWECLRGVTPFEPRTAWDWIDVSEARLGGWETAVLRDVPFYHHRPEGHHAPSRWAQWCAQGRAAHYLGYRPSYLLVRSLFRMARDPAALGLIWSYLGAVVRRSERSGKPHLTEHIREQQRLRNLRQRASEARGRSAGYVR